jgi:DNA repair protein RecO (recombination protein O)
VTHNLRAVVLSSRRSREADKVVTLFTDSLGRVTARATSAARVTAKFAALTEPFVESEIALYMKPGQGWGKVVGGRLLRSFPNLRTHLERSTAASWVCEILQRLTPEEQPSPEKYALLTEALEAIETASHFGVLRLAYALRFLHMAGFGLENRTAWRMLEQAEPAKAAELIRAPLANLGESHWPSVEVKALEQLAASVVHDYLNRPLQVNRFRQMTGVEI